MGHPRLETRIFEQAWELETRLAQDGLRLNPEALERRKQAREQKIADHIGSLGWSAERVRLFTQTVVAYRRAPSIQNYLQMHREFPEVQVEIAAFGGIEALILLDRDFQGQGIDPHLIASALDGDEPGVDALCLRLLELVAERDSLPKSGTGHIAKRRSAISDTTLNYLIANVLEGYDRKNEAFRLPASFVVLARHQLCKLRPDLEIEYRSRELRTIIALSVARQLKPDEKLSINRLKQLTGLPRTTAARWLADPEFKLRLAEGRKFAADGLFDLDVRAAIWLCLNRGVPPKNTCGTPD
jgi:hypothetical protein